MENFLLGLLESIGKIDFQIIWKILGVVFLVFWLVVLDWVWLDSGERTTSRTARFCYVALVAILNIFGWIIYLIIRPSQTIEQIYWADLERRYLKYETAELGDCPKCGTQLFPGFIFCPSCGFELKIKCPECNVYMDKKYKQCPYCGESINRIAPREEAAPTVEVMQQQIQASKDEAAEVVESQKTRYTGKKENITVRIGRKIINGFKNVFERKEKPAKNEEVKMVVNTKKKKSKGKKKKH